MSVDALSTALPEAPTDLRLPRTGTDHPDTAWPCASVVLEWFGRQLHEEWRPRVEIIGDRPAERRGSIVVLTAFSFGMMALSTAP